MDALLRRVTAESQQTLDMHHELKKIAALASGDLMGALNLFHQEVVRARMLYRERNEMVTSDWKIRKALYNEKDELKEKLAEAMARIEHLQDELRYLQHHEEIAPASQVALAAAGGGGGGAAPAPAPAAAGGAPVITPFSPPGFTPVPAPVEEEDEDEDEESPCPCSWCHQKAPVYCGDEDSEDGRGTPEHEVALIEHMAGRPLECKQRAQPAPAAAKPCYFESKGAKGTYSAIYDGFWNTILRSCACGCDEPVRVPWQKRDPKVEPDCYIANKGRAGKTRTIIYDSDEEDTYCCCCNDLVPSQLLKKE